MVSSGYEIFLRNIVYVILDPQRDGSDLLAHLLCIFLKVRRVDFEVVLLSKVYL